MKKDKDSGRQGSDTSRDRDSSATGTAVKDGYKATDSSASTRDAVVRSAANTKDANLALSQPPPINLQSAADCVHPEVEPDCSGGFCRIPAGCFIMGSPRDEPYACKYSCIQVQVTLTHDFEIGETEVTREQWSSVGWEQPEYNRLVGEGECLEPSCPVANVTSLDAMAFANRFSELKGFRPCYEFSGCSGEIGKDYICESVLIAAQNAYHCEGYRLPYEAEWEYAGRAGTRTALYSGDVLPENPEADYCFREPNLEDVAWYCNNSNGRAHPIAQKRPNAWGLHDIHGNMAEWCNDLYKAYPTGPLVDPTGVQNPGRELRPPEVERSDGVFCRVFRSAGHLSSTASIKINARSCSGDDHPSGASSGTGFRLARTLVPTQ
ncbi:MAG: SUMF1/EgtB/PvdO family nonheme iron enzyme [Deltaproteobacteria bacterium]|nr:SUMF1/EgtB/PvdO family nonheme iron enzyme [Deltaproteobacteria bacterium]